MGIFDIFKKKETEEPSMSDQEYEELIKNGTIVPMHLIGLRFGGADDASNIVYVYPKMVEEKNRIDDELESFIGMGKEVSSYMCFPSYKGDSRIPSSIEINATIDGSNYFRIIEM